MNSQRKVSSLLIVITSVICIVYPSGSSTQTNQDHEHHHCSSYSIYSNECNLPQHQELTEEQMFHRGHMKPFGSHHPPDGIVEELKYMIAPEDFYMNYVVKHKPVVIKGAAKYWPAYKLWTDDYLNKTYGDVDFNMETKDDDKENIPPSIKMRDFLDIYKNENRYLVDEVTPDMRKDIILPLCLRCEEISSYFFVSYFWMSSGATSSRIHIDTDENLLSVLHGSKVVHMISPKYSHDLYTDDCKQLGVISMNSSAIDLEKYPRMMNVRYVTAYVEEGDMVYIPQHWWHQVNSGPGRQQAVAMWWKSKPWFKEYGRKSVKLNKEYWEKYASATRKYSYASFLAQYEDWTQTVSEITPRIECKTQQISMDKYHFETDKEADAPVSLGDGGDYEEEMGSDYREIVRQFHEKYGENPPYELLKRHVGCDFDRQNPKSPCNVNACYEDVSSSRCLRYLWDYCLEFEDRGCVIHIIHAMNKMMQSEYIEVENSDPPALETDSETLI